MISPQLEGAAFQPRANVFYTLHGGEKFSVKCGVVCLCFGELLDEESQQLPVLAYLLLQDHSDVDVGGVRCQGENGPGEGVGQGHCGEEGHLGVT